MAEAEEEPLPDNRFELELEFLQCLASPAYLHFLANNDSEVLLPDLVPFLRYLRDTWTQPQYARFLTYPHALFFLDVLIETPAALKEWTLPAFRNFCHQQQFLAWQHRHAHLYGVAAAVQPAVEANDDGVKTEADKEPGAPATASS